MIADVEERGTGAAQRDDHHPTGQLPSESSMINHQSPITNHQSFVRGVRGATTATDNTAEAMLEATADLVQRVIEANGIVTEDIASVIFSATPDLNAQFPAVVRTLFGWEDVALECFQEMAVPGSLPRCIRVLIHWNTTRSMREIVHVYIRGAENLRPDRVKKS